MCNWVTEGKNKFRSSDANSPVVYVHMNEEGGNQLVSRPPSLELKCLRCKWLNTMTVPTKNKSVVSVKLTK